MNLIDFHCDTISKMRNMKEPTKLKKNSLCVDLKKLRQGRSMAQFFALFVYLKNNDDPFVDCLELLDIFKTEMQENHEEISLVRNSAELEANHRCGKLSALLTVEEGGVLKGAMRNLHTLHKEGVRLMTLTWNFPNEIGYPNFEFTHRDKGLTDFGKEVVEEMNRLSMLVDVSHLSDAGFFDVARLSKKPFIASHSNVRAITNHPRNMTDEMIRVLAEKGGVMGINFARAFLGEAEISQIGDMVRHIKHIRNVGGIETIGIGSDFDGISCEVEIAHIGEMQKLYYALQKENFSDDDIDKIFYKNGMRILQEVL